MEKEVKRLLESKLEKIEDLYKYTQDISDALEEENTEVLITVLSSRQRLMEDIDSIDSRLLSFFNGNFDELTNVINSSHKLKEIYNDITVSLKKIRELDDKNMKVTQELFSKLKEDISKLKQAENALKGYGIIGTSSRDGAFIDTKK
ncbi:MAG: flagellar export chaperone FlgN [Tepidanaerobacteraceae bacterium]|jgi:DNA repair ATPase RecN